MAFLYQSLEPISAYQDKHAHLSDDDYKKYLGESCTLYIGNLSFFSKESQL